MTDKLQAIPLTEDNLKQVAELMLSLEITEKMQKDHLCWTFIPNQVEMERMNKYQDEKCPRCGKRVGLQFFHGSMGETVNVVCTPWGKGCGFKEYITDDERW